METENRFPEAPSDQHSKVNVWETCVALAITAMGLFLCYTASGYQFGNMTDIGPGYFPVILSALAVIAGCATLISVFRSDVPTPQIPWRVVFFVLSGVIAWTLLVERFGIIPASMALIVLTSLANEKPRPLTIAITSVVAAIGAFLIFVEGLGIPLQAL